MIRTNDEETGRARRRLAVEGAVHSGEMEGLSVDPATLGDAQEFVEGLIDSDELVARARTRYGLS